MDCAKHRKEEEREREKYGTTRRILLPFQIRVVRLSILKRSTSSTGDRVGEDGDEPIRPKRPRIEEKTIVDDVLSSQSSSLAKSSDGTAGRAKTHPR